MRSSRRMVLAIAVLIVMVLGTARLISRPPDLLHRAKRLCAVPPGMMDFAPLSNDELLVSIDPGSTPPCLGILRPNEPVRMISNHPAVQTWLTALRSESFLSSGLSAKFRRMVFSCKLGTFVADLSAVNKVTRIDSRDDRRYSYESLGTDREGTVWTEMDPAGASHPRSDCILVRSFSDNRVVRTLGFPKGAFADEYHASRQIGEVVGGSCISVTSTGDVRAEGVAFLDVKVRRFSPGLPIVASYYSRLPAWIYDAWACEITPDGKRIIFSCRIQDRSPFHRLLQRLRLADPAPQMGVMECNLDGSNLVDLGRTRERQPGLAPERLQVTPDGSAVMFELDDQIWRLPL